MSLLIKLAFAFLFAFEVSVNANRTDVQKEQLLSLSNAINDFSMELFKKTADKFSGKNIIMSTLSADIALALLSMGAQGGTQAELNTALHLPTTEITKSAFTTMINSLNSMKDITLNMANKVFVKIGVPLSPQFKTLATDVFGSEVENVDFAQSKQASQTINSWVEEKTSNKITDFISPSSLDANTRMILLNAIYLKANWQNTFDEDYTYNSKFILTKTSKKTIKMMVKTENMQYFENSEWNAKMVELPYENGDLSMVIILPNEVDGLNTVINKIGTGTDLTSAFKRLNQTLVNIHLPQFKIESSIDLVDLLKKVGIKKIFETGAELGGLLQNDEPLFVSDAIQKAMIEVGEKGTVAAVVTVISIIFDMSVNADETDIQKEQLLTLSNAINDFSLDLFKITTETFSGKNIIMSPLSADIIMALLSMGAEGGTQAEINIALHLPNAEFTKSAFITMINSLNSMKDITLNIANKVFFKIGVPLSPQFKTLATDAFGSEVENVDFSQSKQAAQTINSWVEEKTSNKIKDFISPSSLDANTRMILLNAIYFKANWQNTFDEYDTYDTEFILTKTSNKTIKMMKKVEKMQYFENSEWKVQMVELPYENGDLSMVIILPNEVDGLNTVINKIGSGADLTSAFNRLNQTLVNIHLPQFKIESSIDLVDLLKKVGIKKIFETGAELGGLLQNDEPLFVSDAIQKAVIEVGEKGTVAAVATGIKVQLLSGRYYPKPPKYVYVDHPFLFCIKTRENIPIFIGQYTGVKS